MIAAKNGYLNCIKLLLQKGVNVDQQDASGRAALHHASWYDHSDVVELLLNWKAQIDLPDTAGHTALHLACWFGHIKTCTVLINHHAPLNVTDQSGRTPLHFACQHNRPEIVQLLIQAGADTTIKNTNGKTAEQIAAQEDRINIIELLQNAIKDKQGKQNDSAGDKPPELTFIEEHNKMKSTIESLVRSRDDQVDILKTISNRVEKQRIAISSIETNQDALKMELDGLKSNLEAILSALMKLKPAQEVTPQITVTESQRPITMPTQISGVQQNQFVSNQMNQMSVSQRTINIHTIPQQRAGSPTYNQDILYQKPASTTQSSIQLCDVCHIENAAVKCNVCGKLICNTCLGKVNHVCPFCRNK